MLASRVRWVVASRIISVTGELSLPVWDSYGEQGGHMEKLAKQFARRDPVHPEGRPPSTAGKGLRASLPP